MVQLTTRRVTVCAESFFQPNYSDPLAAKYVFAYRIRITNIGEEKVQLLSRTWVVTDGAGEERYVEGEGVVGQQPEIMPGHTHEYTSWVQFETPIGAMRGSYGMLRTYANGRQEEFEAVVPRFLHTAPEVLN